MTFALRRHKRVKVSKGQLSLFVEKNFDGRSLLAGIFNYSTCQRASDGSYYGIADGNQCRKGVQVSQADMEANIKERRKKVDSGRSASVLSEAASVDAVTGVTLPSTSEVQQMKRLVDARTDELKQKMDNGEDLTPELRNFVENRKFIGDPLTSPAIVVGMEDGFPGDLEKELGYSGFLARTMAKSELKGQFPDQSRAIDYAQETMGDKVPQFYHRHAKVLTAITGETVAPEDMMRPNGAIAQLELRSVPAKGKGTWELGNQGFVANNPASAAEFGSRTSYQEKYNKTMANNLKSNINDAIDRNPNLRSVVLATGKSDPVEAKAAADVSYSLSKRPGAKSREFSYEIESSSGTLRGKGSIVDPKGDGKTMVYNYGASVSANALQGGAESRKLASKFVEEEMKLRSGQTTRITNPNASTTSTRRSGASASASARSTRANTSNTSRTSNKKASVSAPAASKPKVTAAQRTEYINQRREALRKAKADRRSGDIAAIQAELRMLEK